jgi:flagellar motility protein MotE (MotC chaperone)
MSTPKSQREAAAAVKATEAIRRLGQEPKQPSVAEDLQRTAPKPRKIGVGLIASALVLLILVSSLGGVYLAGRLNAKVREKLQAMPLVGRWVFPPDAPAAPTTDGPAPPATSDTPTPAVPGSAISMALQGIAQAETKIAEGMKQLDEREAAVKAEEERIKQERAALEQAKQEFAKQQADAEQAAKDLDTQVQAYIAMKPAQVVAIFEGLPDDLVVQFLIRMQPEDRARIMAGMDPWRAARLSEKMVPASSPE